MKANIDCSIIMKMLPHRYPFLLIDKVTELEPGVSATGIKNVTVNEPYFQGHFPDRPIVPGVLLLESLAQLTAVMYGSERLPADTNWEKISEKDFEDLDLAGSVGYLAEIRNVKFMSLVKPGDTLELHAKKGASMGRLMQIKVFAKVGNATVVEGMLTVSVGR